MCQNYIHLPLRIKGSIMPFHSKIMLRWHQEKASLTSTALKIKLLFDISTPVVHSKPPPPRLVAQLHAILQQFMLCWHQ